MTDRDPLERLIGIVGMRISMHAARHIAPRQAA
jgi:hypothetical protein